jgi:cobalt-zinc-cadmium efflux system protein
MAHTHDHDAHEDHGRDHEEASHDHSHGGHSHVKDVAQSRLIIALLILGTFTIVEAVGGYFAHSIALMAEAAHMLADCASLILAIVAIRFGLRPADQVRTYGHKRYQPLAAFVNGIALLLLTAWVVFEAIQRLVERPPVEGNLMLIIAVVGGIANLAAFMALSGARSLNEQGARAHVLSDLLGSGAASAAALVIIFTGWTIADPLLSLFVSILIFRSGWALTKDAADVLLESAPKGFNIAKIESELVGAVPGLASIHHVHVWTITGETPMVTLHADLTVGADRRIVLAEIHSRLRERLSISHVTVQIEDEGKCASAECDVNV